MFATEEISYIIAGKNMCFVSLLAPIHWCFVCDDQDIGGPLLGLLLK